MFILGCFQTNEIGRKAYPFLQLGLFLDYLFPHDFGKLQVFGEDAGGAGKWGSEITVIERVSTCLGKVQSSNWQCVIMLMMAFTFSLGMVSL